MLSLLGHAIFLRPESTSSETLHLSAARARCCTLLYCVVDYWHAKAAMCSSISFSADSTVFRLAHASLKL